jgi:hypothetical protein
VRVTSGSASTDSSAATASICVGPSINVSNPSQTSGAAVTLAVSAPVAGDTYSWYVGPSGSTSQPAGSGTSITVYPTQSTTYWVRSSNAQCNADSVAVTVTICTPAIAAQPQSAAIVRGQTTRLSVTATGNAPLAYQWYTGSSPRTGSVISGASSSYYDASPLTTTSYSVRVSSGSCFVDSAASTVSVCIPPSISAIASAGPVSPGQLTSLSVTAAGTGLSYQWFAGQAGDASHPVFSNTATPSWTAGQTAFYWVRITGSCGSVDSAAVRNSVNPQITAQPHSISIPSGGKATLQVIASGTYLSYQWYAGTQGDSSQPIAGAVASTFTTPALTSPRSYWVAVSSGAGRADSTTATVDICVGPAIDYSYSQSLGGGCWTVGVIVSEADRGNVNYLWYKGQPGDISAPVSSASYFTACPTVQTSYWARVVWANGSCYADSDVVVVH